MKRTIVGLLGLFVLALASRTANAQAITWRGCAVYPSYFNTYGDCEAQSNSFGFGSTGAVADSSEVCTGTIFYPGSDADADATAFTLYGAYSDTAALLIGNPPGTPDIGVRTTADAIAWGGIPVPPSEESSAAAEVDCGGNTVSYEQEAGTYTSASAYADITSLI